MHIQLDPVGGVAGDMFAAAVLDAWPELEAPLVAALERAGLHAIATVERVDHADHALTGSRFAVQETRREDGGSPVHETRRGDGGPLMPETRRGGDGPPVPETRRGGDGPPVPETRRGDGGPLMPETSREDGRSPMHEASHGDGGSPVAETSRGDHGPRLHEDTTHGPHGPHGDGGGHESAHEHHLYRDIRTLLEGSDLDAAVRARALDIFARLAAAESAVHGVPIDDVSFHEVGAWDSIADIVSAAWLIERLDASWSCGPLPIGRGRIDTSHGRLPVPAPATVELLRGMVVDQDTHRAERITPTGAAIVSHLAPSFEPLPGPMRLDRSGTGFGTSRLPGTSNVLRLLAFKPFKPFRPLGALDASVRRERIVVCEFEVDDQTGEDLALALDRLREQDGVLDGSSHAMHGKKGRLAVHVRLLARVAAVEAVIESCFRETTTLGVRWHEVSRAALAREASTVTVDGRPIRVKSARRPGDISGDVRTSKAEMDDLAFVAGGHAVRERVRALAEWEGGGADG